MAAPSGRLRRRAGAAPAAVRDADVLEVHPEVAQAIAGGRPVVALDSAVVTHVLPRPDNLATARQIEAVVRAEGAVPAMIAIVDGRARVGLDAETLDRIADADGIGKAGLRDLVPVVASGRDASTTVGATAHLARLAGIRILATGGLGGVHRQARESRGESADLDALARCGVAVVCSGVRSILEVAATLERLASLNVAVVGHRTNRFPGVHLADSGHSLEWRVDTAAEAASLIRTHDALGLPDRALVIANPVPRGASVNAGRTVVTRNAALAARIAVALSAPPA